MDDRTVLVSRGSIRPSSGQTVGATSVVTRNGQQSRPPILALRCNRCRKPLSTSFWVAACQHVFCDECTNDHFGSSANCPTCNKILRENDFTQLAVADTEDNSPKDTNESNLQSLFTKLSSTPVLSFQQMAGRYFQLQEAVKMGGRCLLTQLILEVKRLTVVNVRHVREIQVLKSQLEKAKIGFNQLKLHLKTQRGESEKRIAMLEKKIQEKEDQLIKFRQIYSEQAAGSPRVVHNSHRHSGAPPQVSGGSHAEPPLRGLMARNAAKEQRDLGFSTHRQQPVLGVSNNPYAGQKRHQSHISQGYSSDESRGGRTSSGYSYNQDPCGHISSRRRTQSAQSPSEAFIGRSPSMMFQKGEYY